MIKLQVLLHKPRRNPEGIAKVQSLMQSLGITTTASGAATVSAEIDPTSVESVFGTRLSADEKQSFAKGATETLEFPVPESLREFVESITVAPRHILYSTKQEREHH